MYIEYNTSVKSLIDNQILKMIFNIWLSIKDFTGIQTLVMSFQCVQILSIVKTMSMSIISLHIHVSSPFCKNKKILKYSYLLCIHSMIDFFILQYCTHTERQVLIGHGTSCPPMLSDPLLLQWQNQFLLKKSQNTKFHKNMRAYVTSNIHKGVLN